MNDEIKEILELFGSTDENIMFGDIVELNSKQSHQLLKYITNLQRENERLNKTIDTILEYNIFKDECPLNYGYDTKSDEEKAQDIFNEEYCEKCKDDYKKCWLDYFEELKKMKEGK